MLHTYMLVVNAKMQLQRPRHSASASSATFFKEQESGGARRLTRKRYIVCKHDKNKDQSEAEAEKLADIDKSVIHIVMEES